MYSFEEVVKADPELAKAMELETNRQNDHIELIASENFVSKAVMAAMGSTLYQQVRRRISGKTLLWRMPVCRYGGRSG